MLDRVPRMTNRARALLVLLLTACGDDEAPPPSPPIDRAVASSPNPSPSAGGTSDVLGVRDPLSRSKLPPGACASATAWLDHTPDEWVISLEADNHEYVAAECGGDDDGIVHADRAVAAEW